VSAVGERNSFLREAEQADRQVRNHGPTLAYAGARPSEALAFTAVRVDLAAGALVIASLKKRRTAACYIDLGLVLGAKKA